MGSRSSYNRKKTAKEVKYFFANSFWHYMNQGGMHPTQLSSPIISDMPVNHSNLNTTEKNVIGTMSRAEHARYLAEVILITVYDLTNIKNRRHRDLVFCRFIKNMSVEETKIKLNFSEYQFKREQPKALCEFAERFNYFRYYFEVEQDLPNLIRGKNNKNLPNSYHFQPKITQN